jgi:hypothetical protein
LFEKPGDAVDQGYVSYIAYIVGFSSVLLFMGIFAWKRLSGRKHGVQAAPITGGNIGVFFDKSGNVMIIPYVMDKFGQGRATAGVQILRVSYSTAALGDRVRVSMQGCLADKPCSDEQLMSMLGFRTWKEYSEGKRNVSVHYREGTGIVFNSTTRRRDGSYQFNRMGFERVEAPELNNIRLGEVVLELLKNCR